MSATTHSVARVLCLALRSAPEGDAGAAEEQRQRCHIAMLAPPEGGADGDRRVDSATRGVPR